jgi:type IV secretory pathway TraG/TraD family ATPase VirD4
MTMRLGTAEWADPGLIEKKYLYRDGSIWLGRSPSGRDLPLGYRDDRHVCLVSGTRGGKGTTSIVNSLLLWPGSVCVIDPKGENASITAQRRGRGTRFVPGLGQAVHVLDPFGSAQVDAALRSRFNPLDALDPNHKECINQSLRIADAIVSREDAGDHFWDEQARSMVYLLILHILTAEEYQERRNLVTLRQLIIRGDWEAGDALRQGGEKDIPSPRHLLWQGIKMNNAFQGLISGLGQGFWDMLNGAPETFEGVLANVRRNTEFIDGEPMQDCLAASDFKLSELKSRPGGLSLYLCLPLRYLNTHNRWLRMIMNLTVTEMEMVRGQPATGHQTLIVLDEFASLERMPVIENAVAQIAGYGVKLFFVLQSLEQLKAVYKDRWETFLANAGLKVFFNVEDQFSREYVSKLVGETEVMRDVRSESNAEGETANETRTENKSRTDTVGQGSSEAETFSQGSNSSVTDSDGKGSTRARGGASGWSSGKDWTNLPFGFRGKLRDVSGNFTESSNSSDSTSEQSSRATAKGESTGSASTHTKNDSSSQAVATGESLATAKGTAKTKTGGVAETVHKRPLIYPDEIGQRFASVDDQNDLLYPGLALVLIAGERPMYVRRVKYYEDPEFIGLFSAHPDHEFSESQIDVIEPNPPYWKFCPNLSWHITAPSGKVVQQGEVIGEVLAETKENINGYPVFGISVRAPRSGRLLNTARYDLLNRFNLLDTLAPSSAFGALIRSEVPRKMEWLVRYYESATLRIDPFKDLGEYLNKLLREKRKRERAKPAVKFFPEAEPLLPQWDPKPVDAFGDFRTKSPEPVPREPVTEPEVFRPRVSEKRKGMFRRAVERVVSKFRGY